MEAGSKVLENQVGRRIREVRKSLGLKQQEFAAKLNMSGASLSEIETGKYKPGCDFMIKLHRLYNANIHYLLLGRGEMFMDPLTCSFLEARGYALNLEDVRQFLHYFQRSSLFQYHVLSQFKSKMMVDGEMIKKEAGQASP